MIRYALVCEADHDFEGWFGASGDFDDQMAAGRLACPVCATAAVRKQIMAPAVAGTRKRGEPNPAAHSMMMEVMGKVRAHVEDNFDYVGDRFAAEAREIHAGTAETRGIYGEASPAEVKALVADGVPVAPLPPAAPRKTEVN
ncbi:MAG TPA: DUF1178 family protein [Caulobacteraceae bacterium]|jgi:hypothetical protein